MVRFTTWALYTMSRLRYTSGIVRKNRRDEVTLYERGKWLWRCIKVPLTFLHCNKGEWTEPRVGTQGGTLLVRKTPAANPEEVRVGDLVMVKDPRGTDYIVRKLAAMEGWEMGSHDPNDVPFVLGKDECWILSENEELSPKEAYDSRTFGKVSLSTIVGRAIYCLRSAEDHGPVKNSRISGLVDGILIEKELNLDEMMKFHEEANKE